MTGKATKTKLPSPIVIIGGGKMGGALVRGWVKAGISPSNIYVVEKDEFQQGLLKKQGVKVVGSLDKLPKSVKPAVTVLAIKPQGFAKFRTELKRWYKGGHIVISIMAGITLKRIANVTGVKAPVVRAMPNTPALIGEGVTGYVAPSLKATQRAEVEALLAVLGEVVALEKEEQIDAVTAVSGSGPAYVFAFLEALIASGVKEGLSEATARQLALQTLSGSVALSRHAWQMSLAQLRQNVTSPGGTTEAALKVLLKKDTGLNPLLRKTVRAAAKRSKDLAKA